VKGSLSPNGIRYGDRDISQDEHQLDEPEVLGHRTSPLVTIGGVVAVAFSRERLNNCPHSGTKVSGMHTAPTLLRSAEA
jgi:hypothetical protein